jgi:hypothetical protein
MKTFKEFCSEATVQATTPAIAPTTAPQQLAPVAKSAVPQITGKQVGSFINGADAKTIQQIQNACATRLKQLNPQSAPQQKATV